VNAREEFMRLVSIRPGGRFELMETSADKKRRLWVWAEPGQAVRAMRQEKATDQRSLKGWRDSVRIESAEAMRAEFRWLDMGEE
jgi:hypothetical protein